MMSNKPKYLTVQDVDKLAESLVASLVAEIKENPTKYASIRLFGVPRGGIPAMLAVRAVFSRGGWSTEIVNTPDLANIIIDDIADSGTTLNKLSHSNSVRCALITNDVLNVDHYGAINENRSWIVFPWEETLQSSVEDIPLRMLQYIGEDVKRPGLLETPSRVVKAWDEWFSGYKTDIKGLFKTFEDGAENVDAMVILTNIPVWSHCEHHLAPFHGVAHVGYIPNGNIVGLSKIARVVDAYSRRLQVQERLTNQIADAIEQNLSPLGVGVVVKAQHTCMSTRGACVTGVDTITSAMRGVLHHEASARAEFFSLIKGV